MNRLISLAGLALGASLLAAPALLGGTALAQGPAPAPAVDASAKEGQLTVTGTARVQRSPDYLEVSVGLFEDAATAGEAQARALAAMSKVVGAVKALGLSGVELQTQAVRLDARFGRAREGEESKIIGYRGEIGLRVRTSDLKAAARIIDAGIKAGANRVGGVEFGLRELIGAREEALKLAMAAAKRKAAVMADGLGVRLGRVVTAGEQSTRFGGGQMVQNYFLGAEADGPAGEDAFEEGKVEVTAEVSVTFAVEPQR